jgi:hypothetical protein
VTSTAELHTALQNAAAGDVIELAPGSYTPTVSGNTRLLMQDKAGTAEKPIIICGPLTAIIDENASLSSNGRKLLQTIDYANNGEPSRTAGLVLRRVSFVRLQGLTITNTEIGLKLSNTLDSIVKGVRIDYIEVTGISGYRLGRTTISDSEISRCHRGVILDYSSHCTISNLRVYNIGNAALKLHRNSTHNTITSCHVTGAFFVMQFVELLNLRTRSSCISPSSLLVTPSSPFIVCMQTLERWTKDLGKVRRWTTHLPTLIYISLRPFSLSIVSPSHVSGIYIGSASSNSYYKVGGKSVFFPDYSNFNTLSHNVIGPRVTADMIDLKPLTSGGTIVNNTFDGTDISGETGADSWVAANGNSYTFKGNKGKNLPSFGEGFPTRVISANPDLPTEKTGYDNVFEENHCDMAGADTNKYCIRIINPSTPGHGNIVNCNNVVVAPHRLSNQACGDVAPSSTASFSTLSARQQRDQREQAAADEAAYEDEERDEARRDDPPPRGWLQRVFPRNDW